MLHFDNVEKQTALIDEGEYEVTLNAEWKERNGKRFINCAFKIRKDVEQKFGNRIVFDAIYKSKTSDEYQPSKISGILDAIPAAKRDFETYDDLIQFINNQNMRVYIKIKPAEGEYPEKNEIDYLSYKPTQAGNPKVTLSEADDVDADELPF